ncbi:MAG: OmpA family protein [Methylococcaceae bacterium]
MKPHFLLTAFLSISVLSGCTLNSLNPVNTFLAENLDHLVKENNYQRKTDTFLVINDSSSSMNEIYLKKDLLGLSNLNYSKHAVEKELIMRMNNTIPIMPLSSGLRSFGFGSCVSWEYTHLNQAIQSHSRQEYDKAIYSMECAGGGTPIKSAINSAQIDLQSAPGKIAVILFSDGHPYNAPINAVSALQEKYADRLCLYTVWVGNEKETAGQATLNQLSETANCGFSTTVHEIASKEGMADFVTKVFFEKSHVVIKSIEGDADQDGVLDSQDRCPGTLRGASVNQQGCWIIRGINFDTDKSNIKSIYYAELNNVAAVINNNPGLKIEIQGHTDNQGSANYNAALSLRRAQAVKNYLDTKINNSTSLTAKGFGLSMPTATNDTAAGRSQNRRVQLKVLRN